MFLQAQGGKGGPWPPSWEARSGGSRVASEGACPVLPTRALGLQTPGSTSVLEATSLRDRVTAPCHTREDPWAPPPPADTQA